MSALRTLLVDDHVELRKLLQSILQEKTECVVIGEASDGLHAIEQAKATPTGFDSAGCVAPETEWNGGGSTNSEALPPFEDHIS